MSRCHQSTSPPGASRRGARVGILALLAALLLAAALAPSPAAAHPLSTSQIELEPGEGEVNGKLRVPTEKLAIAVVKDQPAISVEGGLNALLPPIRRYLSEHIAAEGADGRAWEVALRGGHIEEEKNFDDLVLDLTLTPPDGQVTAFRLTYDAVIEAQPFHKAFLVERDGDETRPLGVFAYKEDELSVDLERRLSHFEEFNTAIRLGVEHIGEGADHLLFLLMLLLPAPLMIRTGRWVRSDDPRRAVRRIVHVVTAFAIGHSVTLALAGAGLIHVPSRPVESLIALSILCASIHVIRPLIARGEVLFAVGFGLVHGLAFASLLGDLDLGRGSLVYSLLGFNLGIELMQLLVVALLMPSLYLLSRTPVYTPFRIFGGSLGIVLAGSWFGERTTLTPSDPFEFLTTGLVEHPFLFVAGMAVFAVASYFATAGPRPAISARS